MTTCRFSSKLLFFLTAIVATCAFVSRTYLKRVEAIKVVGRHGGQLFDDKGLRIKGHGLDVFRAPSNVQFYFSQLRITTEGIDAHFGKMPPLGTETFQSLRKLGAVSSLGTTGPVFDDSTAQHLCRLEGLRELSIDAERLTARGMSGVCKIRTLVHLSIDNWRMPTNGLSDVVGLPMLRVLVLHNCSNIDLQELEELCDAGRLNYMEILGSSKTGEKVYCMFVDGEGLIAYANPDGADLQTIATGDVDRSIPEVTLSADDF